MNKSETIHFKFSQFVNTILIREGRNKLTMHQWIKSNQNKSKVHQIELNRVLPEFLALLVSSLAVAVAIISTRCAYLQRYGQAESTWVAGYILR